LGLAARYADGVKIRVASRPVGIAIAAALIGLAAFCLAFGLERTAIWTLRLALVGIGLTMLAIVLVTAAGFFSRTR
jgi:hypothetical protein